MPWAAILAAHHDHVVVTFFLRFRHHASDQGQAERC